MEVVSEVPDVHPAFGVGEEVVGVEAGDAADVGMLDEGAARLEPHDLVVRHARHEHPPVGQPTQA